MLERACYRIKTQLGISDVSYSHCIDNPVFGTGQGSCSSPLIWSLNGSLYFDVFDRNCYGARYTDLAYESELQIGMAGYVDDNSCQTNCHPDGRQSLIPRATHKMLNCGAIFCGVVVAFWNTTSAPTITFGQTSIDTVPPFFEPASTAIPSHPRPRRKGDDPQTTVCIYSIQNTGNLPVSWFRPTQPSRRLD